MRKTIQDFLGDPSKKEKIKTYLSQFPDDQKQSKLAELNNGIQRRTISGDMKKGEEIKAKKKELQSRGGTPFTLPKQLPGAGSKITSLFKR